MFFNVFRLSPYGKVFDSIVSFDMVKMMNNNAFWKIAKVIIGNTSMLQDTAFFICKWMSRSLFSNVAITFYIISSLKVTIFTSSMPYPIGFSSAYIRTGNKFVSQTFIFRNWLFAKVTWLSKFLGRIRSVVKIVSRNKRMLSSSVISCVKEFSTATFAFNHNGMVLKERMVVNA